MSGWNFAEVWETVAEQIPDAPCQVQGDRRLTWAEVDRRANGIAATLLDRGATEQDKVAQYLYNGPEYIESMFGAFKAGLVPINTNYRYMDDELVYLWDNADCVAVVFHGVFTDTIERIRDRWVADGRPLLVGHSDIAHKPIVARTVYNKIRKAGIDVDFITLCDCSDHGPFEHAGIPAGFAYSGREPDYHSPSDTPPNLKPDDLMRTGRAVRAFLRHQKICFFEIERVDVVHWHKSRQIDFT